MLVILSSTSNQRINYLQDSVFICQIFFAFEWKNKNSIEIMCPHLLKFLSNVKFNFNIVCILCLCMYMDPCVPGAHKVRRECQIPWNQSHWQLWATLWVLGRTWVLWENSQWSSAEPSLQVLELGSLSWLFEHSRVPIEV